MPDITHAPSAAAYTFGHAMSVISQNADVICRRVLWGHTVRHVSLQSDAHDRMCLMFTNESGMLSVFEPSPDDIASADWQII